MAKPRPFNFPVQKSSFDEASRLSTLQQWRLDYIDWWNAQTTVPNPQQSWFQTLNQWHFAQDVLRSVEYAINKHDLHKFEPQDDTTYRSHLEIPTEALPNAHIPGSYWKQKYNEWADSNSNLGAPPERNWFQTGAQYHYALALWQNNNSAALKEGIPTETNPQQSTATQLWKDQYFDWFINQKKPINHPNSLHFQSFAQYRYALNLYYSEPEENRQPTSRQYLKGWKNERFIEGYKTSGDNMTEVRKYSRVKLIERAEKLAEEQDHSRIEYNEFLVEALKTVATKLESDSSLTKYQQLIEDEIDKYDGKNFANLIPLERLITRLELLADDSIELSSYEENILELHTR